MSNERWRLLPQVAQDETFGSFLKRTTEKYEGNKKKITYILLAWLCRDNTSIYCPKNQSREQQELWIEIANILGLRHVLIEINNYRFYCRKHNKFCSRSNQENTRKVFDVNHECYISEIKGPCISKHRIAEKLYLCIIGPEINTNEPLSEAMKYISKNGYINESPFSI